MLRPYESRLLECALSPLREENEKKRVGVHEDCVRRAQKFSAEERGESDAVFAVCRGGVRERAANGGGGVWERRRRRSRGWRRGDERHEREKEEKSVATSTKKGKRGTSSKDAKEKDEVSIGTDHGGGGERLGDYSGVEVFQSVHGMSADCYAFVSIISFRSAKWVQKLLPAMTKTCSARTSRTVFKESVKLRERFADLKSAQVKTISFITYLVRGHAQLVLPYQQEISLAVVDLLKTCPDVVSTRKELLVATRHALSAQNFCRSFFQHLDSLLDEHALVGAGRLCAETLRPLAYSFLAELVHHMRAELTLPQIRKTVHVFSTNMQDERLPLSVQMTCARLMHHLVESIFRRRAETTPGSADEARSFGEDFRRHSHEISNFASEVEDFTEIGRAFARRKERDSVRFLLSVGQGRDKR